MSYGALQQSTERQTDGALLAGRPFLLRVAGLHLGHLLLMRATATAELCQMQRDQERLLRAQAGQLSDTLAAVVPSAPDAGSRRALIQLRRDIFNYRHPARRVRDDASPRMSGELRSAVDAWCAGRAEVLRFEEEIRLAYARELAAARARLREGLRDGRLQQGIALASSDLFDALRRYLDTPVVAQSGKLSKHEHSLVEYLTRAAAKTSPFSTFTSVAAGWWRESDGAALDVELDGVGTRSLVRPNSLLIHRLWAAYLAHEEVRRELRYRLHPACRRAGEHLAALVLTDDPTRSGRYFGTAEKRVRVPLLPPVQCVVDALSEAPDGELPYRELARRIAALGAGASPAASFRLLDQLIALRILQPHLELPEQAHDALEEAASRVAQLADDVSRTFAHRIADLRGLMKSYETADGAARVRFAEGIREHFRLAAEQLGVRLPAAAPTLYEDTALDVRRADASLPAWRAPLDELHLVQQLQPLWDPVIRYRLAAADLFAQRHGAGGCTSDVGAFLRELQPHSEEWLRTWHGDDDALQVGAELREVRRLNELYGELRAEVLTQLASDRPEASLRRDVLQRLVAELPSAIQARRASNVAFCQIAVGDGEPRVVLNQFYAGLGKYVTRFLPLLGGNVTRQVGESLHASLGRDVVPLELPGVFGFNGNLHPPLAPLELRYAGLASSRPERELVDLGDLVLRHDERQRMLRLFHAASGRELHPWFPGFLVTFLLPPTLRMLSLLFADGVYGMNPHGWAEQGLGEEARHQCRSYPRLMLGNLVLARRAWYLPASLAPAPGNDADDCEYFQRVQAWKATLGLPPRVFVRNLGGLEERTADQAEYWRRVVGAKPQFIEWDNPLLVRLFAKLIRNSPGNRLMMSEMLPDAEQTAVRQDGHPTVSELLVDLDQPPRTVEMEGVMPDVA